MFPIFWLARVWEKHVNTKSLRIKRVNTKTNQFSPFFGLQEFEKNMSTPKLVFFHFLDSRSLRKNMSTPKLGNFPIFWIPGVEKYIYIYVYACPFKPFWKKTLFLAATLHFHILPSILVYADGSKFQSVNTKTSQFSPFFDLHEFEKNMSTPKVWEKNVNTKTNQFSPFFGLQEFEKKHVNTKTSNFFIFWIPGGWEKTCQHQNYSIYPFFGFQELRNIYIYMYMYICMSVQTLLKEDIVFRGNFTFPYLTLYSGICGWF